VAGFVGVSNMLERDGRRFTVRPEKIRLLGEGEAAEPGEETESGVLLEVVYLGSVTRYIVDLDAGGALTVVRQNVADVTEDKGQQVSLAWRPEHTYVIEEREGNE
jgi:putative spermidine/putrescine transport system ATP-binding protein